MGVQIPCIFSLLVLILNILARISHAQVEEIETRTDENATLPIVTIPQGTLQGGTLWTKYNRSISAFQGIPYGQPPIGNLRFSSPVAASAWNGTLNATMDGSSCPQSGNVGQEDCLYLNVYTPQLPGSDKASLLPVMMFIPGGGFESGNGDSDLYGPGHLLDADLLLVSINYRLGPLGFLSTGDEVAPGNWGLKDQVLALQWVQNNIAYFGGDPNQVTIFGQSAGGASVQLLALSESTIGLFHKFISHSGAAYGFWTYQPRSSYAKRALELAEILGCPTNTSSLLVECLRGLDATEIIDTRSQFLIWNMYPWKIWGPTDEPDIEGAFLTDSPTNLLAAGKVRDLPSITGIVRDDGLGFMPGPLPDSEAFVEFIDNLDELLPPVLQYSDRIDDEASFTAALKEFYFNNDLTTNLTQVWSSAAQLVSDALFIHPVYKALQKQLAFAENPAFFYFFEYRGTFSVGAPYYYSDLTKDAVGHCDELLYLFPQTEALFGALPEEMSDADFQMIDTMVQLWSSFAINGTPTTTATISNTTWSPYSSEDNYLRIGNGSDPTLELQYNFLQERMQFWEKLTATGSGDRATSLFRGLIFLSLITHPMIFRSIFL